MKQIKDDIKTGNFKNLYLFYGDENYLKKLYENKIKEKLIPKEAELMNLDIFESKACSVEAVIASAETLPFMSEYRLVLLKQTSLFTAGRKDDSEKMANYLSQIPESTVMVFIENEVDKRSKIYKALGKHGHSAEFKTPSEKELIDFIIKFFNKNNKEINNSNAVYLIRQVGSDMGIILVESEKIISYKGNEKTISKQDIELIATKSLEAKIFDMIGAMANKRIEMALSIYNNLMLLKESPIMVLSLIARQFKLILQTKIYTEKNISKNEIASLLQIKTFVVTECLNQSKNFNVETLLSAIEDCLDTDIKIKTGKINDKLGVELLIMKYGSL